MITGDHAVTAEAIAHQLGIEGRAITGADFRAMSDDEAMRQIDGIGVIARVSPEDKVHLVDILRKKGHVVGMTGDGVNDAPALKKADIGIAMGITGTEVSKQAAVMILTDDNYATIVKAVGLGRAVYDNMLRFIRFQMAGLFGYIATFLGSAILNIVGGIPFLPLQTLWLNFTVNVFQGLGLGLRQAARGPDGGAAAAEGAEDHAAPAPDTGSSSCGLVMAAGTLGVLAWASGQYGDVIARTMGVTTFALFRLFSSLETADEDESVFGGSILGEPAAPHRHRRCPLLTIVLATELGFLQRILGTASLSADQWAICIVVAAVAHRGRGGPQGVEDLDRRSGGGRRGDAGGRRGCLIRPTRPASSGRGPRARDRHPTRGRGPGVAPSRRAGSSRSSARPRGGWTRSPRGSPRRASPRRRRTTVRRTAPRSRSPRPAG